MQDLAVILKLYTGDQVKVGTDYGTIRSDIQFNGMLLDDNEVIFNANRETEFSKKGTITYSNVDVNVGSAMNTSGIFTAPVSGIYFFHFQSVSQGQSNNYINLYHDGKIVSSSYKRVRSDYCFILHTVFLI